MNFEWHDVAVRVQGARCFHPNEIRSRWAAGFGEAFRLLHPGGAMRRPDSRRRIELTRL